MEAAGRPCRWRVLSLYRAESETELNSLLQALPLRDWMRITVTPLAPHPNDPAQGRSMSDLPEPRLTPRLQGWKPRLAGCFDIGDVSQGHRRIVPRLAAHSRAGAQREVAARRERRLAD